MAEDVRLQVATQEIIVRHKGTLDISVASDSADGQ
jgi:hypothetical protein